MSTWSLAAGFIHCLDTTQSTTTLEDVATDVAAIKAKTDSLTFTVAGEVNANTRYIKGQAITGSGSEADPWGP